MGSFWFKPIWATKQVKKKINNNQISSFFSLYVSSLWPVHTKSKYNILFSWMKFTHVNTLPANNFIESILTLSHIESRIRATTHQHLLVVVVIVIIGDGAMRCDVCHWNEIHLIIKHHSHNMRLFWTLVILQRFSIIFAWLHFTKSTWFHWRWWGSKASLHTSSDSLHVLR